MAVDVAAMVTARDSVIISRTLDIPVPAIIQTVALLDHIAVTMGFIDVIDLDTDLQGLGPVTSTGRNHDVIVIVTIRVTGVLIVWRHLEMQCTFAIDGKEFSIGPADDLVTDTATIGIQGGVDSPCDGAVLDCLQFRFTVCLEGGRSHMLIRGYIDGNRLFVAVARLVGDPHHKIRIVAGGGTLFEPHFITDNLVSAGWVVGDGIGKLLTHILIDGA